MGRIAIERQACVGRASASQTITETRSKGKAFDRCEIRIDRTIDIESAVTANGALTHHSRMVVFTFIEKRRGIIIAVFVLQQCAALVQGILHVSMMKKYILPLLLFPMLGMMSCLDDLSAYDPQVKEEVDVDDINDEIGRAHV